MAQVAQQVSPVPKKKPWRIVVPAVALFLAALVAGGLYYRSHRAKPLTDKDTIVLADFSNTTGDPVFEHALKQALSIQLGRSPFLNVLSALKVRETLTFMGRSPNDRVTDDAAREICERTGSSVTVSGSITMLGSQYILGLSATNCHSGEILAQEQVQCARKEDVLSVLSQATTKIRAELGESRSSIQKFDSPIAAVTTPSLEALNAFSLAVRTLEQKSEAEAIPLYKRAIELDPNFALAYASLGTAYANLEESDLARENYQKAYELRDRVSERERFLVISNYYSDVTGEQEKSIRTIQLWAQSYPRDATPHNYLGYEYVLQGFYDKAVPPRLFWSRGVPVSRPAAAAR